MSTRTPWGPSQFTHKIARGIAFHSTAGHGGFHVSPSLLAKMPVAWRRPGGWYEEDCESAMVVLSFPSFFTPEHCASALHAIKAWFPDEARAAGIEVHEHESLTLQQRAFTAQHAHDFVGHAAWGDWHPAVPKGMVAVCALKTATHEEAFFLVHKTEYATPTGHPFVINPSRHPQCPPLI